MHLIGRMLEQINSINVRLKILIRLQEGTHPNLERLLLKHLSKRQLNENNILITLQK